MAGKGTPATALLAKRKVPHEVHTYTHQDAGGAGYGEEAVREMGQDPRRVFKTLVALVDGVMTVGIVPVAAQLDLKALAAAAGGKKAVLADVADAERATGYVAGGISPLGQRRRLPTVVDDSAREHPTVFCSGGRRGLEIELAPDDLVALTGAVVAPIAAG
ncbi:Cys-tRNA(Pro) deacylase YbaK [Pseudonocardia sp. Ae168_Ps1]|uniref:Cys-tRNA(Pro) deacylase n=1 Tax=unclassified Pseudonocardia TaxID=2619320 RepID=UPI00094AF093|nr:MULTISPECIES: Cys-tRNA(Pro) deacylase [unclassified Pseudonocardia]OLL73901.1 Cys-tRNA(Pro) deacylase YbaK [Pseudonocardia sp. Ae150A_Ps1]OLL79879.1 Cys-tRNA(Pro) deacylase YbaK [Pseudonocardia sp. Ae168_Ps1]OLL85988.1 Cys-tRNA(Pro) deacylase YbaK [Pseudonocardia sp. Ae263_Ps1]OLL93982.1 Cys-tRNA(Pro) deacylase YbaK [Pseudonocardia sp. Ae356_Ps1]